MKIIILAGLMITLPAIVIMIWFAGHPMMIPALASFAVNILPFIAMIYLMRGRKGNEDDMGH